MEKWRFDDNIKYGNRNFQKLIDFYLFHCPVENQTVRGLLFSDYGWTDSKFHTLKSLMLKEASSHLSKRYIACKKDELENYFNEYGLNIAKPNFVETVVFLSDNDRTVMRSLYRAIRHAFAHGSFSCKTSKNTTFYYLENFDGYCKARLVLKEESLLAWIDIIKAGLPE